MLVWLVFDMFGCGNFEDIFFEVFNGNNLNVCILEIFFVCVFGDKGFGF